MNTNRYETVCIVKPDVGDEVVKGVIQKVSSAVEADNGKVLKLDEWGRKRLAYPIQKKNEGYYFVIEFECSAETSREIGRILKLNEDVLRYQTIRLDEEQESGTKAPAPAEEAPAEGGQA